MPNDDTTMDVFDHVDVNYGSRLGSVKENILDPNFPLPERSVEIILEAGDALHIPYVSWHAVINLEPSVAYSLRIRD